MQAADSRPYGHAIGTDDALRRAQFPGRIYASPTELHRHLSVGAAYMPPVRFPITTAGTDDARRRHDKVLPSAKSLYKRGTDCRIASLLAIDTHF